MHDTTLFNFIRQVLREAQEDPVLPSEWMVIGSSKNKKALAKKGREINAKWLGRFELVIAPSPTLPKSYDLKLKHV